MLTVFVVFKWIHGGALCTSCLPVDAYGDVLYCAVLNTAEFCDVHSLLVTFHTVF